MRPHCTALSLLVLALSAAAARSDENPDPNMPTFVSGDKKVRYECFDPKGKGPHPLMVLLPGIDGLAEAPQIFRGAGQKLADQGFVVLLPYYHDRTETNVKQVAGLLKQFQESLKNPGGRSKGQTVNRKLFRAWEGAVCDAVAHGRALKNVDRDRVVLVGYSLGGFLATAVAAKPEQDISALVVLSGGITRDTAAKVGEGGLPPTFVIHGKLDPVVSVAEARRLTRLLEDKGVPWDDWIHPMLGHGFVPKGGFKPDLDAVNHAQEHAVAFIWKHIGRGD